MHQHFKNSVSQMSILQLSIHHKTNVHVTITARSSAAAAGPCDVPCSLKSCQLLHNCTKNPI